MKILLATLGLLVSVSAYAKKYTCSYEYIAKGAQVIVTRENVGVNKDGTYVACTDALTACQAAVKKQNPPVKCRFFIKGEVK